MTSGHSSQTIAQHTQPYPTVSCLFQDNLRNFFRTGPEGVIKTSICIVRMSTEQEKVRHW